MSPAWTYDGILTGPVLHRSCAHSHGCREFTKGKATCHGQRQQLMAFPFHSFHIFPQFYFHLANTSSHLCLATYELFLREDIILFFLLSTTISAPTTRLKHTDIQ